MALTTALTEKNFDEVVLQDFFLEQVSKTPDAVAVVDGTVELTYAQLNALTDTLAIQLIEEYAVKPDVVVGILLPRSVQYIISYVAVLKAGGAYMPLELVYPKTMLERAVTETGCHVVLTNAQYANRVAEQPHIVLGENENDYVSYHTTLSYPTENYVHPKADHLAFVVMSSGTTGMPKGICQTHRAAVHSYNDRWARFPYQKNAADGSNQDREGCGVFFVWELYRPLCRGVTAVVIPDHVLFDPPAVTKFISDFQVTRILFTPSLLQLIMDTVKPAEIQKLLKSLNLVWLCGEVVTADLARSFSSLLPHIELMNLYSISECHDVSIGDLKRELGEDRKYATCGTAIPGVKFYIVDLEDEDNANSSNGQLKLVEKRGETGEVYVGGPVVGRGYLNMPEKTAERFVANPFDVDDVSCSRLYRTGDLGRLLPDGQLEILGRCDFMVKIRGYSVVLGAIESALAKHPKIKSSVVLAVGNEGSRDKKLVAYVVPTNWHDVPSASSVRNFLKQHVPPYAIPSTFCVIDALPVAATAAGKVDRKLLPSPEAARRLRAFSEDNLDKKTPQRLAPENDVERGILEIWAELLEVSTEDLSALDSFYEVGGHSLLATRLVAMVNEKFGKTTEDGLSIINVVEGPTVREMAQRVSEDKENMAPVTIPKPVIDLQAEAAALDPSIYPFPTRKGNTMSRFRLEATALIAPRVVFLTGATGWLGAHILAELLRSGVSVIAMARAKTDELAKDRLVQKLKSLKLISEDANDDDEDLSNLIAVAGDLSQPLLGMDNLQFKSLALEIDSIIHCGAEVNLMKPYASLKESNVLGTQEILRLATTNGFVKTKVKPVHYVSSNGVFPVDTSAYPNASFPLQVKEDVDLQTIAPHLREGYAMTKWVAEQMCTIAESRGLPVSVLRPGNMAGSSVTGVQNPDDFVFLLIEGMLTAKCAPIVGTNYALDLTPVDFAAKAVVQFAVNAPQTAIGQRFHLQNPQAPVPLTQVVEWLKELGHDLEPVSKDLWVRRIATVKGCEKLSSGWISFEKYFEASTWLSYGSDNLQQTLQLNAEHGESGGQALQCPQLNVDLLERWFGKAA